MGVSMSEPAIVGVVGGGTFFVLLLVPMLIWQTRRYGRVTAGRVLGSAAVSIYLVALVAYTLLPTSPLGEDLVAWCAVHGFDGVNLNPLQFVADIREEARGLSGMAALMNRAVLQLALNVLLFIPWGIMTRGFLGWGKKASVLSAVACSLLIEVTQATGVFGLIPCSYRYGDVDDLLTNALGGIVGVFLAPLVLGWMPRSRDLARTRGVPRPVTARRRWFGMFVDWLAFFTLSVVLEVGAALLRLVRDGHPSDPDLGQWVAGALVPFVLVFVVPACVGSGASIGQRIVWLVPRWGIEDATTRSAVVGRSRRILRALFPGGLWGILTAFGFPGAPGGGPSGAFWALVVGCVAVLAVACTKDRRGLSGIVSGCRYVDERSSTDRTGATSLSTTGEAPDPEPSVDVVRGR